jgi:large subunit ribosomal protein L10
MPKTRVQKEESVASLTDKLGKSKSVVFANYQGMTMAQLQVLRRELRTQGAEFSITKNNLLKLALKNSKMDVDEATIDGPTATLFSFEDEISPIKSLTKAIKDNSIGSVKGGLLDGEFLDQYKINKLASLPTKDELRAKVVGSLGAPLYGIVGVLQANIRNLVYALDQIRVSKGGEV